MDRLLQIAGRTFRRIPRTYRILLSYIAREYLFAFLVSFLFFFFVFFVNQMLVIARDVLSRQVDVASTLLLIVYALPAIIALAFPFASLVGAMMAVGRFSTDNEIVAMQALGVSLWWVLFPILVVALLCTVFSFIINDYFLPIGTVNYIKLYQELIFSNSELILEPYAITKTKNTVIVTDDVSKGKMGRLLILDTNEQGQQRIISASQGSLARNDAQAGIISLDLQNVFVFNSQRDKNDFDYSFSDSITYTILLQNLVSGMHNPGPREMSSADVLDSIAKMESGLRDQKSQRHREYALKSLSYIDRYQSGIASPAGTRTASAGIADLLPAMKEIRQNIDQPIYDTTLQLYWIEYWKKFSIPAGCFTLVFLGFPAGMFARRSGRSIGFGIGFVIAAMFWAMLLVGQSIGVDNPWIPSFALMWAPNILFFFIGIVMLLRRILR